METSPTSVRIKTRATNKDAHPGQPDVDEETLKRPIPKRKRTKAEILASKQEAQAKKEAKAAAVVANVKRREDAMQDIAQFENRMELDDIELKKKAARPTPKIMVKIPRPTVLVIAEVPDSTAEVYDYESDGRESEIVPLENTAEPDGNDEAYVDGYEEEMIHEAPDEVVVTPVKVKSKKKKDILAAPESLRQVINKRKLEITSNGRFTPRDSDADLSDDGIAVGTKRKPPPDDVFAPSPHQSPSSTIKRGKPSPLGPGLQPNRPQGLLPGWKNAHSRSGSFTSSNASSPGPTDFENSPIATPTPSGHKVAIPIELPVSRFDFGGYEDEDESKEAEVMSNKKPANELKSLVKVQHPAHKQVKAKSQDIAIPSMIRGTKSPRIVFSNNHLPPGTALQWTRVFIPSWVQYLGSTPNVWNLCDHLQSAQDHWDLIFPSNIQVLALKADPIFAVLKQRTYEWRRGFMTAAVTAVQAFWESDPAYADPMERAAYVEWAFPDDPNEPIPGIWASVDDDFEDINNHVYKGAFQAVTVITTFAQHLAILRAVPKQLLINTHAEGALALSATAVEHVFRRWATGHNVTTSDFSAALSEKTDLYSQDISAKLTSKSWAKIMAAAEKMLDKPVKLTAAKQERSVRQLIVDADSD
ncbi:hypothetical protein BDZ94DRAFT_1372446 [Collybia nuda]|uniref:DUF6532 domain-containing protein n=1 Tax=Collybia nuda TaxID=64659 RepID=A0A9P5Y2M9_9AGAR|nr:hypothetical protein BDZ94DRAFT_1372446 [Collybia nuda]